MELRDQFASLITSIPKTDINTAKPHDPFAKKNRQPIQEEDLPLETRKYIQDSLNKPYDPKKYTLRQKIRRWWQNFI